MISSMEEQQESDANALCKACGLCCTGHLFIWTKLKSAELNSIEALGVRVIRSVPSQRGFNQPCPLWQGMCTIYASSSYPHFCRTYKCKLLKKLLDETVVLPQALSLVEEARRKIDEVEAMLPPSPNPNFRERLEAQLETPAKDEPEFRQKAGQLLALYEKFFGVTDVVTIPSEL
jgi:uncharacterized protein